MSDYLITTERIGLRNWREDDLADISALNRDPEVMRFFPALQNTETTLAFIHRMQKHFEDYGYCYFAADLRHTGEFIGFIGLCRQDYLPELGTFTDIGWRLKQQVWGKGLATEGAKACLTFAYENAGLDEVYAVCPAVNLPSEKVMQKIGMTKVRHFNHPALRTAPALEECMLYLKKR